MHGKWNSYWKFLAVVAVQAIAVGSWAVPISIQLDSIGVDSSIEASATIEGAPIVGSGDITLDAATQTISAGMFTLPTFSAITDVVVVPGQDATITTTGLSHTNLGGTFANVTSTGAGSLTCVPILGSAFGTAVCGGAPTSVSGFGDGNTTVLTLTDAAALIGTIVSVDVSVTAGTTVTTTTSYSFAGVPEPGTLLLLASGMAGLALLGRRR